VARLNVTLWAAAAGRKLLSIVRALADTTVICLELAYPADSGLLAKVVGRLVRTAASAVGRLCHHDSKDRPAASRGPAGSRGRRQAVRPQRTGPGRDDPCHRPGERPDGWGGRGAGAAVLRYGRRAVPKALVGRLPRANELAPVTIQRTGMIVAHARARLGIPQTERLAWSACTIPMSSRSAIARQFGYKAQITVAITGCRPSYGQTSHAPPRDARHSTALKPAQSARQPDHELRQLHANRSQLRPQAIKPRSRKMPTRVDRRGWPVPPRPVDCQVKSPASASSLTRSKRCWVGPKSE